MSQHDLNELIHDVNKVAKFETQTTLEQHKKTKSVLPALGLVLIMFICAGWNYSVFYKRAAGPSKGELEKGNEQALMILSDSLVTEYRDSGELPDQLIGPLAGVMDVDYRKLNQADFELVLPRQGKQLVLKHQDGQDEIFIDYN